MLVPVLAMLLAAAVVDAATASAGALAPTGTTAAAGAHAPAAGTHTPEDPWPTALSVKIGVDEKRADETGLATARQTGDVDTRKFAEKAEMCPKKHPHNVYICITGVKDSYVDRYVGDTVDVLKVSVTIVN